VQELSPENTPHLDQEMKWNRITAELASASDRLGKPIDSAILPTVVALRMIGFQTNASCEGHLDHGIKAPWIEVGSVSDDLARRALSGPSTEESSPHIKSVEELQAIEAVYNERSRLIDLLDKFYSHRQCSAQARLIVMFRLGQCRMISQGYGIQDGLPVETQSTMLDTYRTEMKEFTDWLKTNCDQSI
jgi:hypothetical protein